MKTVVTGAAGFVGGALLKQLVSSAAPGDHIVATDLAFATHLPGVAYVSGSIDDADVIHRILENEPDRIFHLATVAGVQSAADFALGKRINFDATLALLESLRVRKQCPRFIYSSSVGVYGPPLPSAVDDDTLPVPTTSYGTHKLTCELMIGEYTRAGFADGLALRFPGVLARPAGSATMISAFMSNMFAAARHHQPFSVPMDPNDGSWLMSLNRCVHNVLHAASLPKAALPARRYWTLPALFVTMGELVSALAEVYGPQVRQLARFEPVTEMRAMFSQVPLRTPGADRLGFIGDRSATELVRNAIVYDPALQPRG